MVSATTAQTTTRVGALRIRDALEQKTPPARDEERRAAALRYSTGTFAPMAVVRRHFQRAAALAGGHVGLLAVLAIALWDRLALLRWWKAFPGGDTYNFILIAQEILRGGYPIAEKRLPVYPLLLLPARLVTGDWEMAAVVVALLASLIALVLLYALGRTLGLGKTALVAGLLAFETITPLFFQSIRGYADTTFVALTLGVLVVFLRARAWPGLAAAGFLASLTALTRPEGVVVVPLLAAFSFLPPQLLSARKAVAGPLRRVASWWVRPGSFLTAAALTLLLFALVSLRVGRPLTPAEYLKDAEVTAFGATGGRVLVANVWRLWQSLGADRLWAVPRNLVQGLAAHPAQAGPRLWSFLTNPKELPGVLAGVGLLWLLLSRPVKSTAANGPRRRGAFLPVFLTYLALSVPIAWWGVRQRFLVSLSPLPFLLLAGGTQAAISGARRLKPIVPIRPIGLIGPIGQRGLAVALLLLSLLSWRVHNAAEQREVIAKNQGQGYAYYQAIQYARGLEGRVAFAHRSSVALALFGEPDRGRAVFADTHLDARPVRDDASNGARDPAVQWEQIQQWDVRYLVVRQDEAAAFPVLTDPAFRDRFVHAEEFTFPQARGGPDRATVYEVR